MTINQKIVSYFRSLFPSLTKGLSDFEVMEIVFISGINYKKLFKRK